MKALVLAAAVLAFSNSAKAVQNPANAKGIVKCEIVSQFGNIKLTTEGNAYGAWRIFLREDTNEVFALRLRRGRLDFDKSSIGYRTLYSSLTTTQFGEICAYMPDYQVPARSTAARIKEEAGLLTFDIVGEQRYSDRWNESSRGTLVYDKASGAGSFRCSLSRDSQHWNTGLIVRNCGLHSSPEDAFKAEPPPVDDPLQVPGLYFTAVQTEGGKELLLTQNEAILHCARQGLRLPTAKEMVSWLAERGASGLCKENDETCVERGFFNHGARFGWETFRYDGLGYRPVPGETDLWTASTNRTGDAVKLMARSGSFWTQNQFQLRESFVCVR